METGHYRTSILILPETVFQGPLQIHLLLQLKILLIWQQSELKRGNKLTEHFGKFSETTFFRFKAGQNW
jgi:hypothetical protein